MAWQNKLEAICAFPSILLDQIVTGTKNIFIEEKQLAENGEFDQDDPELDNS